MKIKVIIPIITLVLILSCASSRKQFKKGNYDRAIAISTKKLRKNPAKEKETVVLIKSYRNANKANNERIKYLKLEGKPDVWEEIYNLYNSLKARQSIVESVLPLKLENKPVIIKHIEYNSEIVNAKRKAAEYLYVHAMKLYNSNKVYLIRRAYDEFKQVKHFYSNYKDVDKMIIASKKEGTINVFLNSENHTHFKLPKQFVKDMIPKSLGKFSSKWVDYYANELLKYDYKVTVKLKRVMVSPELLKEERFTENKTIRDGWKYKLDNNGNVMKDTLGNDIKIPKFIDISCEVIRVNQRREISLFAEIEYKSLLNNRIDKNIPIKTDWFIENMFATANGDLRAMSKENAELLGNKPIAMPTDIDMIFNAGDVLRDIVDRELRKNKRMPE